MVDLSSMIGVVTVHLRGPRLTLRYCSMVVDASTSGMGYLRATFDEIQRECATLGPATGPVRMVTELTYYTRRHI
jgi:hypothetical protein